MSTAYPYGLEAADWNLVTESNNPFKAGGAAVCDPASADEDHRYVVVGITKHVVALTRKFMGTGRARHFSVVAPLGYGKSRSFAAVIEMARSEFGRTSIVVYIKFSGFRTYSSAERVSDALIDQVIVQVASSLGITPKEFGQRVDDACEGDLTPDSLLYWVSRTIPKACTVTVLIDEVEKLIESDHMSQADKVAVMNLFKEWADKTKNGVCLGLALTTTAFEWVVQNLPDIVQRFDQLPDSGFMEDETSEFIWQQCSLAFGSAGKIPFDDDVVSSLHNLSQGIPRVIESIAHECWNRAAQLKRTLDASEFAKLLNDVYGLVIKDVCRAYGLTDREIVVVKLLLYKGGYAAARELHDPKRRTYRDFYRRLYALSSKETVVGRKSRGVYYVLPEFLDEVMRRKYQGVRGGVS